MRKILFVVLFAAPLFGGPLEFGRSELSHAMAERGISTDSLHLKVKMLPGKLESYSVTSDAITGADDRGLMYGLLAAAEQIRTTGHVSETSGSPAVAMRGIRYFVHNHDLEQSWYYSRDYWDQYFSMLARNRFNRFNLVFAHQTNYLAPPYPFWLDLPEFPQIRVPGLTAAQRGRNLEMLQYISQTAADHGIDFTLGVWEHNIQIWPHKMVATVEGISDENIGPYSYAALKKLLELCPAICSVQMRTNAESGIPDEYQLEFYRDYVFRAIHDAGRPVYLDLRAWAVAGGMIQAAQQIGIPLRVSTKYWAEDLGRPYQPAETYPGYSYLNFLEKPHAYQFYWELWGLGSHRLLLWGNPEYVRRAVSTFHLGDAAGFEIDPPLAQKGFGNRPGEWTIFTPAQKERIFWKWEFQRYWFFYELWGRLSYDPGTPDSIWLGEMRQRFGAAAPDVLEAYRSSSGVVHEIVAAHLADPNMYLWPEINPGGLLDAYRDALPSDWRYVASIQEAVQNRIRQVPSAKQTPAQTAALLNRLAENTELATGRADQKITASNAEWRSSLPDFQVLAFLARYHALKQTATDQVNYFDKTGDRAALDSAKQDLEGALQVWERLVALTDNLYPQEMAFGPDDVGHWKDKLPYVRHDLELVRERRELLERFGRFDFGFDFGGPVQETANPPSYRATKYVLQNTVAPRFQPVDAKTLYNDDLGYGWRSGGDRVSEAIPLTPYAEVQAVGKDPGNLPRDVLYRDYIRGRGVQLFGVKTPDGQYQVHFLRPDRSETRTILESTGGLLDIAFPQGEWSVSGLVIQATSMAPVPPQKFPKLLPRPMMVHEPPKRAVAGQPIRLRLQISPMSNVTVVRLHYRPVNQNTEFKMLDNTFTIPGKDVSPNWDLMYYFEVLNNEGTGWFDPDPLADLPPCWRGNLAGICTIGAGLWQTQAQGRLTTISPEKELEAHRGCGVDADRVWADVSRWSGLFSPFDSSHPFCRSYR